MERVYVGNLPPDIRIKDIDDFFRPFGKLIYIDVNHRANPVYAFVQFDSARNAFNAVKARHGYDYEGYTLQMRLVENEVRRRRDATPPPPMLNDYRNNSNSNNNRMGGNSNSSISSSSFQTYSNQLSGNINRSAMQMDYASNNRSNMQKQQNMSSFLTGGRSNNNNSNRSNMLQQYGNNGNNSSRGNMSQDNMNYSNRNMMNYSNTNTNRYDMSQQKQQNMNMMGYSNNANSSNWVIGNNDYWSNNANNNSWDNGNNSWNSGNNSSWNNGNNSWNNGNNSWNNGNNSSWNNGNNNSWSGGNNMGNIGWNDGNNANLDMGNNFNNNANSYVYNANNDPYSKSGYEDKYTSGLSGSGRKWFNRYIRKGFSPEMARAKALEHRTVPYLREHPKNVPDPNDPTNAALETIGNTILSLLNTSGNVDNFNNANMMPGNANWVADNFQGPSTSNARGGRGANMPPGRNPISKESYLKSLNILRRYRDKHSLRSRDRIAKKFHSKIVSDYERFERVKTSSAAVAAKPSKNTKTYAEMTVTLRKKKQQLLTSARRLEKDPKKRSGPEYRKRMKILINEHGFPEIEARSLAVHPMHNLKSLLAMKAECEQASSSHRSGTSLTANVIKKRPARRNTKDRAYRNDINYLRMYETHKFSTISQRARTALRLCLDRIHKHEKEANMPLTKTKFSKLLPKVDGKKKTTAGSSSSKKTPAKKTNTKKGENKDDKKSNDKKNTAKDKKSHENIEDGNVSENEEEQEEAEHDGGDNEGGQEEEFEDAKYVEQEEDAEE